MSEQQLPCLLEPEVVESARGFWNEIIAGATTAQVRERGAAVWLGDLNNEVFFEMPYVADENLRLVFNLIVERCDWRPRKMFNLAKFDEMLIKIASQIGSTSKALAAPGSIDRYRLALDLEEASTRLDVLADRIDAANPNGDGGHWQPIPDDAMVWGHCFGHRVAA